MEIISHCNFTKTDLIYLTMYACLVNFTYKILWVNVGQILI